MKFTLASLLVISLAACGLASPATGMRNALSATSNKAGVADSINDKAQQIKKNLDEAVKLLKEVSQQQPAFAQPLARPTAAIYTLDKAIESLFIQYAYATNKTNPSGGYKAAGPRYGGYKPPVYVYRP